MIVPFPIEFSTVSHIVHSSTDMIIYLLKYYYSSADIIREFYTRMIAICQTVPQEHNKASLIILEFLDDILTV